MSAPRMVPTVAKPASAFLGWGVSLTVLAFAMLLAAGYFGLTDPPTEFGSESPSVLFAWAGWIGLGVGVTCLWVGVLRLVQHADRDAGVTYPMTWVQQHLDQGSSPDDGPGE